MVYKIDKFIQIQIDFLLQIDKSKKILYYFR
jgi:hypothetical protein